MLVSLRNRLICRLPAKGADCPFSPTVTVTVSLLLSNKQVNVMKKEEEDVEGEAEAAVGGTLWGQMGSLVETESGIAALEREQITKTRSLQRKGAPLRRMNLEVDHLLEKRALDSLESRLNSFIGDQTLVNSIELMQFLKRAKNEPNQGKHEMPRLTTIQPMRSIPSCQLHPETTMAFIKKALILICVYTGYETTSESVLQVLADVCSEFLSKTCEALRVAVDTESLKSSNDFVDPLDRVFREMGFSLSSLNNYNYTLRCFRHSLLKEVNRKYGPLTDNSVQPSSARSEHLLTEPSFIASLQMQAEACSEDSTKKSMPSHASWEKSIAELDLMDESDVLSDFSLSSSSKQYFE